MLWLSLAVVGALQLSAPKLPKTLQAKPTTTECGNCDSWSPFSANCKPCDDGKVVVNGAMVSSKALRQVEVMDAEGTVKDLTEVVADKSVVVFLRHLG